MKNPLPKVFLDYYLSKYRSLNDHQNQTNQGFSLIEVLVSTFVLSGFLIGSLQATTYAAWLSVQTKDKQEARKWLQQDLELIRYQSFILDRDGADSATCSASSYGNRLQNTIAMKHPPTADIIIENKAYEIIRSYTAKDNIVAIVHQINCGHNH